MRLLTDFLKDPLVTGLPPASAQECGRPGCFVTRYLDDSGLGCSEYAISMLQRSDVTARRGVA